MPDDSPVLHTDDPEATFTFPDGRVVRNLSAEEYAATWAVPDVHGPPADVLAAAEADAARIVAAKGASQ